MSYTPLHCFPSASNNSTTPLAGAATFTGTGELHYVPDVSVSCQSDVAGTLYFQFSNDNSNWTTFPTAGFTVAAGVHEYHNARVTGRYFRVSFTNGASAQSYFRLYTYFGWFGQGIAPIGFTIADDADAIVTKSVISGVGNTTATVTNHKALQTVPPREGKATFGGALVESLTPVIQVKFPYNYIDPDIIVSQANQSGSVTASDSMVVCASGAAANSGAEALTADVVSYRPGQGVLARFSGLFTTPAAGSTQLIGIGDSAEGLFFGYSGTSFGIMHRYGGAHEIRTLTITTKSTTAENITITLDGDAIATVAVTDATAGDTTTTANDIAAADYSDVGKGWHAEAVGSTVVFTSWSAEEQTGTYTLSGAATAVGTFAQSAAGVAPSEDFTAQADWNGSEIFDGNGLTGETLVPTYGNTYQIGFQYLGFGTLSFFVGDSSTGEFHVVHTIAYANAATAPSFDNPTFPMYVSAINAANTSNLIVKSASLAAFTEGAIDAIGVRRGADTTATISTANETPFLSLYVARVFQSLQNKTKVKLLQVALSVEHTKPLIFRFYKNATLTGASFSSISSSSPVKKSTSSTAITGGTFLFAVPLGKSGQTFLDFKGRLDGLIQAGDVITITADAFSGTGAEVTASLYWVEIT
jgi:hypothetical protein